MNQIKEQLKTLKLSGILENLELRMMEAQQNHLSYSEFLSMLLTDEIEEKDKRKVQRLIRLAKLGEEKTLENFDFSFNSTIKAANIRELATCHFIEKGEGIFFLGPTGTGKTHLAKAISHQACRKHFSVFFYNFHHFFNEMKTVEAQEMLDKFLNKVIKADLLVIDDFGFKKIDQKSAEYLYAIVDAKYTVKSIILTSNRAITDWGSIFPDPLTANAILDRLAHNSHQIIIKGESYRKKMKPKFKNA